MQLQNRQKRSECFPVTIGLGVITNGTKVRYRVSFLDQYGNESNASGATTVTTAAGDPGSRFYLDNIPTSSDGSVIARRLYREQGESEQYLFLEDIPNNIQIGHYDNLDSFYLGTTQPGLLGQDVLDYREPPKMNDVGMFRNHVFGINAGDPFKVEISNPAAPEQFPLLNQVQFDDEIKGIENHPTGLLLHASDSTFLVAGTGVQDFIL